MAEELFSVTSPIALGVFFLSRSAKTRNHLSKTSLNLIHLSGFCIHSVHKLHFIDLSYPVVLIIRSIKKRGFQAD